MTRRRAWRVRGSEAMVWRIHYSRTVLRVLAREWYTLRLYRTACRSYLNTSIDKNSRPGLGSRVSLSGLGGTHSIGLTITWICTHWCRPNTLKPCKSVRSVSVYNWLAFFFGSFYFPTLFAATGSLPRIQTGVQTVPSARMHFVPELIVKRGAPLAIVWRAAHGQLKGVSKRDRERVRLLGSTTLTL